MSFQLASRVIKAFLFCLGLMAILIYLRIRHVDARNELALHAATSFVIAQGGSVYPARKNAIEVILTRTEVDDEALNRLIDHLQDVRRMIRLNLVKTKVTDKGAALLVRLDNLQSVDLTGTKVSLHGMTKLRQLLPNVMIGGPGQEQSEY